MKPIATWRFTLLAALLACIVIAAVAPAPDPGPGGTCSQFQHQRCENPDYPKCCEETMFYYTKCVAADQSCESLNVDDGEYENVPSQDYQAPIVLAPEQPNAWAVLISTTMQTDTQVCKAYAALQSRVDKAHIITIVEMSSHLEMIKGNPDLVSEFKKECADLLADGVTYDGTGNSNEGFRNILVGKVTEETPTVVQCNHNCQVFLNINGHGGYVGKHNGQDSWSFTLKEGEGAVSARGLIKIIQDMKTDGMRKFSALINTCYSGGVISVLHADQVDFGIPTFIITTGSSKDDEDKHHTGSNKNTFAPAFWVNLRTADFDSSIFPTVYAEAEKYNAKQQLADETEFGADYWRHTITDTQSQHGGDLLTLSQFFPVATNDGSDGLVDADNGSDDLVSKGGDDLVSKDGEALADTFDGDATGSVGAPDLGDADKSVDLDTVAKVDGDADFMEARATGRRFRDGAAGRLLRSN